MRRICKFLVACELLGFSFFGAPLSTCEAANGAWTLGGGQGRYEYRISNSAGDTLVVENAVAADPDGEACSISFEAKSFVLKKHSEMNLLLDGKAYSFELNDGQASFSTKTDREQLFGFVYAILQSKSETFIAEFPSTKSKMSFNSKGSRKILSDALDGCN